MKTFLRMTLSLLFVLGLATDSRAAIESELAKESNQFAFDVYGKLSDAQGNVMFSPFSILSALSMTYEGAAGETAAEMRGVLHLSGDPEILHEQWLSVGHALEMDNDANELNIANALWVNKTYPLKKNYSDVISDVYGGVLYVQDFADDSEGARLFINNWVSEQTKNRIKDLLPPDSVDELTRLVITNAIYFKGKWASSFPKSNTKKEAFYLPSGQKVQSDLMASDEENFEYFENC